MIIRLHSESTVTVIVCSMSHPIVTDVLMLEYYDRNVSVIPAVIVCNHRWYSILEMLCIDSKSITTLVIWFVRFYLLNTCSLDDVAVNSFPIFSSNLAKSFYEPPLIDLQQRQVMFGQW